MIRKNAAFLAAFALAAAAIPASAQTISAGAAVKDTSGGEVGTVTKVDGDYLIVKTDKHEVRLPRTSFTPTDSGLLFGLTRDQLNAQVEQALAAANAKIVVGATVTGAGGAPVGTIDALDAQFVTLKLASGAAVRLPRAGVAAGPNGVVTSLTLAELQAAAGPSAAAEPAAEEKQEGDAQ